MKYNEAIDMILDGGRAYSEFRPDYKYFFDQCSGCLYSYNVNDICKECHCQECSSKVMHEHCLCEECLHKYSLNLDCIDVKLTDWIVEKDGVVYEKKPNSKVHIVKYRVPEGFVEEIARRRLEDKIIADEVNEDWLEKKMLCVIRRELKSRLNHTTVSFPEAKCHYPKCHFCFPQAHQKPDHTEELREKVTVEDVEQLVDNYYDALSVYHKTIAGPSTAMMITEKETLMRLNRGYLMREIKYLTSLQEK